MAARGTPTDGEAAEDRALGPDHAFVASQRVAPFVQRLRELGWIEGRTVAIEYRWAEGRNERAAEIAAEFVRLKVDVIVTQGTPSVIAAKQATSVIPIVFAAGGTRSAAAWSRVVATGWQRDWPLDSADGHWQQAYRFSEGQYDRLPMLASDLVRRSAKLLVATDGPSALTAKAATTTIPIIFGVGVDPVEVGLVASLNRPSGNSTGVSFFTTELGPKRLGLLRELMPKPGLITFVTSPRLLSNDLKSNIQEAFF